MGKMIKCGACGKDFEKQNVRGRPPKECPSCKNKAAQKQEKAKIAKEKASEEGLMSIPVLKQYESVSQMSVDDIVYVRYTSSLDDVSQRMFARPYRVVKVGAALVDIVRDAKVGYRHYPASVPPERLSYQDGVEYVEARSFGDMTVDEGND